MKLTAKCHPETRLRIHGGTSPAIIAATSGCAHICTGTTSDSSISYRLYFTITAVVWAINGYINTKIKMHIHMCLCV